MTTEYRYRLRESWEILYQTTDEQFSNWPSGGKWRRQQSFLWIFESPYQKSLLQLTVYGVALNELWIVNRNKINKEFFCTLQNFYVRILQKYQVREILLHRKTLTKKYYGTNPQNRGIDHLHSFNHHKTKEKKQQFCFCLFVCLFFHTEAPSDSMRSHASRKVKDERKSFSLSQFVRLDIGYFTAICNKRPCFTFLYWNFQKIITSWYINMTTTTKQLELNTGSGHTTLY